MKSDFIEELNFVGIINYEDLADKITQAKFFVMIFDSENYLEIQLTTIGNPFFAY